MMIPKLYILLIWSFSFFLLIFAFFLPLFLNPIYGILCFLFLCLCCTLILLHLNIYYLSIIFLIIYAGAIVVLFLFLLLTTVKHFISFNNKTIVWPTILQLITLNIINFFYSKILNSNSFKFDSILNNGSKPMDTFFYNLQYFSNDLYIISEYLFTNYFVLLYCLIFTLLFTLIYSIVVIKGSKFFKKPKNL